MAFLQGNIFSKSLAMETQLYISMPQDGRMYEEKGLPKTLILLHGMSDNASGWARRSQVDYLAEKYGIGVFMPEVQRSFYQDMCYGMRYYTYISQELPELIDKMFSVSTAYEDLMVAGLSMGGYGAMRVAFGNPDRFSACGAFSAACDAKALIAGKDELRKTKNPDIGDRFDIELDAIFGLDLQIPDDSDLYKLVEKASGNNVRPKLYHACGTEDMIYTMNVEFSKYCKGLSLDYKYEEWSGEHNWDFWNPALAKMLNYFLG